MATIKICDRCGAAINPESSATCVHITKNARLTRGTYDSPVNVSDVLGMRAELCVSCAYHLREWLQNKPFPKEGEK